MTPVRVAAAVVFAALAAAGCGSVGRTPEGSLSQGKQLFNEHCAQCHMLRDAGSRGQLGPDLDASYGRVRNDHGFAESTLRDVVRGQIAYPVEVTPTGEPGMPANLVTGDDADAVAAYVAAVAGTDVEVAGGAPAGGGGEGGGEATDGRAIFDANCATCHTLADAGSAGTIGPNLDEAQPSVDEAVETVTKGRGNMPPFSDSLSEEQIRAVSEYVAETAGS